MLKINPIQYCKKKKKKKTKPFSITPLPYNQNQFSFTQITHNELNINDQTNLHSIKNLTYSQPTTLNKSSTGFSNEKTKPLRSFTIKTYRSLSQEEVQHKITNTNLKTRQRIQKQKKKKKKPRKKKSLTKLHCQKIANSQTIIENKTSKTKHKRYKNEIGKQKDKEIGTRNEIIGNVKKDQRKNNNKRSNLSIKHHERSDFSKNSNQDKKRVGRSHHRKETKREKEKEKEKHKEKQKHIQKQEQKQKQQQQEEEEEEEIIKQLKKKFNNNNSLNKTIQNILKASNLMNNINSKNKNIQMDQKYSEAKSRKRIPKKNHQQLTNNLVQDGVSFWKNFRKMPLKINNKSVIDPIFINVNQQELSQLKINKTNLFSKQPSNPKSCNEKQVHKANTKSNRGDLRENNLENQKFKFLLDFSKYPENYEFLKNLDKNKINNYLSKFNFENHSHILHNNKILLLVPFTQQIKRIENLEKEKKY
ncbi:hypothetical protein M0813_24546 [Anaeramoeba flamelloides]|uniref:Uncharacterized protein n=1 Tax=Anaeramoeba flamelloides TaxID=1746091 RepID=A0ABQ8Y5V2_9EUKA|nr:hypothetical protein M0813_24546 [Anaeramoeba flamelloides]